MLKFLSFIGYVITIFVFYMAISSIGSPNQWVFITLAVVWIIIVAETLKH